MKADIYSLVSLETASCHLLSGSHQKPQFWFPLSISPTHPFNIWACVHACVRASVYACVHTCVCVLSMLMDAPAEATALCPDIFLNYFCTSCLRHVLLMDLVYSCLYWLAGKLQRFTRLYPTPAPKHWSYKCTRPWHCPAFARVLETWTRVLMLS